MVMLLVDMYCGMAAWAEVRSGRTLRSEELAGDVELFAADDDDFLAVEQLFGDGAGQTAEEVAFAVYHNLVYPLVLKSARSHLLRMPAPCDGCQ